MKVLVPWCVVARVPTGTFSPQYSSSVTGVEVEVGFASEMSTFVAEPVRNWQMLQVPYAKVDVAYFCCPTGIELEVPERSVPDT